MFATRGAAQEAIADAKLYRVLIPVDDRGAVLAGARRSFPNRCTTCWIGAARLTREPRQWLVTDANYAVWLKPSSGGDLAAQVDAMLKLRVFSADQQVRLDFGAAAAGPLPAEAVLAGQTITADWREQGRFLTFLVEHPGDYELHLRFEPLVRAMSGAGRFDLPIPPLAFARLQLSAPDDQRSIEVESALGPVIRTDTRNLSANLGPAGRLAVRWRDKSQGESGPMIDVEELHWLRVKPGSVVVNAKFRYQVMRQGVRALRWLVDSRLRMLPGANPRVAHVDEERPAPGVLREFEDATIYRIELARPLLGGFDLEAQFVLKDTSGVGRVTAPLLAALDARSTRRWLGVSLEGPLELAAPLQGNLAARAATILPRTGEAARGPRCSSIRSWMKPPRGACPRGPWSCGRSRPRPPCGKSSRRGWRPATPTWSSKPG